MRRVLASCGAEPPDGCTMVETIHKTFAESGLTMLQLSQRAGVHYQTVHGLMGGYRSTRVKPLARICEALGLRLVKHGPTEDS